LERADCPEFEEEIPRRGREQHASIEHDDRSSLALWQPYRRAAIDFILSRQLFFPHLLSLLWLKPPFRRRAISAPSDHRAAPHIKPSS
jgi:hypothetical protein